MSRRAGPKTRLTEEFTYNVVTEDYSTGDLVITEGTPVTVYGNIKDLKSDTTVEGDKRRDTKAIKIECRADSVDTIDNGVEITLDNGDIYTVSDVFEHEYEWMATIIAHQISN